MHNNEACQCTQLSSCSKAHVHENRTFIINEGVIKQRQPSWTVLSIVRINRKTVKNTTGVL